MPRTVTKKERGDGVTTPQNICETATTEPDEIHSYVGTRHAPQVTTVDFSSLSYVQVAKVGSGSRKHPEYVLRCGTKPDGDEIDVPIEAVMKKALPDIIDRVARRGIVVRETESGWRIPPDLLDQSSLDGRLAIGRDRR